MQSDHPSVASLALLKTHVGQPADFRTAFDVGLFVLGCAAVIWIFSQFRGWGIIFWGGIGQLVIIGAVGYFVMRRLYRRAFGSRR